MIRNPINQTAFISRNLYFLGMTAKIVLVCGVLIQAFFMTFVGSLHVSLPFIVSMTNIVAVIVVISVHGAVTKRILQTASGRAANGVDQAQ
jgi:hypothetical protein